ncbi:MAG: hypothetical protein GX442_26600 [Candidatus Riflebacteria bacterium]|nr:hypothetical protein [Candidatus Riflebacteria bacterium]
MQAESVFHLLIILAFAYGFLRMFSSRARGVAPERIASFGEREEPAPPEEALAAGEPAWETENPYAPRLPLPRSNGRLALAFAIVGIFGLFLHQGFSLDQWVKERMGPPAAPVTDPGLRGKDWAVVDGIRWFRFLGTDSAGVGYDGWVSELAFQAAPPESSGEGDLLQKVGLPSVKERVEAARRLRNVGNTLRQTLSQP